MRTAKKLQYECRMKELDEEFLWKHETNETGRCALDKTPRSSNEKWNTEEY